jgi:hypothetical protein
MRDEPVTPGRNKNKNIFFEDRVTAGKPLRQKSKQY